MAQTSWQSGRLTLQLNELNYNPMNAKVLFTTAGGHASV